MSTELNPAQIRTKFGSNLARVTRHGHNAMFIRLFRSSQEFESVPKTRVLSTQKMALRSPTISKACEAVFEGVLGTVKSGPSEGQ